MGGGIMQMSVRTGQDQILPTVHQLRQHNITGKLFKG